MRLLNAYDAIAAGVIDYQGPVRRITVHMNDSSMPRMGGVFVRVLLFPGCSLPREATLVGALAHGHSFAEVSIERGANSSEAKSYAFISCFGRIEKVSIRCRTRISRPTFRLHK